MAGAAAGTGLGYRHKARLGVKHVPKKGKILVGFRERSSSLLADLQRCEVLHPRIGGLLQQLGALVDRLSLRTGCRRSRWPSVTIPPP